MQLKESEAYLPQLFQHRLFNTILLEIDSRAVNDLVDDGLVNRSHCLIRHSEVDYWEGKYLTVAKQSFSIKSFDGAYVLRNPTPFRFNARFLVGLSLAALNVSSNVRREDV